MAVKLLNQLTIGEVIQVNGERYTLAQLAPLAFDKQVSAVLKCRVPAAELFTPYNGADSHMVVTVDRPFEEKSIVDSFREQLFAPKESLLDNLKKQLDSSPATFTPIQPGEVDLTASLKAQALEQRIEEVRNIAVDASNEARDLSGEVSDLAHETSELSDSLGFLTERVDQLEDTPSLEPLEDNVRDLEYHVESLDDRLSAIENQKYEEERSMNIQQQFDEKLALQKQFNDTLKTKNSGGNGTMKNVVGAFKNQFGKVEGKFAFSILTGGLALRKGISQEFIAYNKDNGELTDVSGLTLKFDVPAFKLPVAAEQIEVGDLVIHNAEYVYVTKKADGYLETLNPEKAVRGSLVPTKNALLGAAFYTVVKTLDAAGQGGFNPMLLMAMGDGNKDELVKMMALTGGFGGAQDGQINPMMFALLGDNADDILPFLLMQQGGAVEGQGIQSILPFLLLNDKEGKKDSILPLLAMTGGLGGAQATQGAVNPMMMMALAGDGEIDMTTLALMGGFGGQGLFQQQPAPQKPANKESK